jgi:uncharacterized protein (DUF1697 family)
VSVTLYQMAQWNRLQAQAAAKKAQQERQAAVMAVMKKPAQIDMLAERAA